MSERPRNSQAPASPSEDLVEHLKAAANNPVLLLEIVESNDNVSVAAAIGALLNGASSSAINGPKHPIKACNRPCRSLPTETFVEVVLFADRDTLDAMQLVCSFLLNFIKERELTELALRAISTVKIGKPYVDNHYRDHWLPLVELDCNRRAEKELVPKSVHHLTSCLRMAFCESVCMNLIGTEEADMFDDVRDMLFHDLVASNTIVGKLTIINKYLYDMDLATRAVEAFKSVKAVNVEFDLDFDLEPLGGNFFVPAVEHAVRHIELKSENMDDVPTDTAAALSFGFAEPKAGGDRSLLGVACEIGPDFLAQVKQASTETRHVDFTFKLANVSPRIASTGFEKYQKDEGRIWLMNDLENRINVEVKQTESLVEIHVFS